MVEALRRQVAQRQAEAGQVATGFDHMIQKELARAESYGMELAMRLPEYFLKEIQDVIDSITPDEEN